MRILIIFVLCICFLGVKADDSGEINFALQGYIKDLNEAKTDDLKSFILSKIITESGRSDIDLAEAYLSKFKNLVTQSDVPIAEVRYLKARGVLSYYKELELDSILYWYDQALTVMETNQIEDTKIRIGLHNNRAIAFLLKGHVEEAVQEYLAGIETISKSKDKLYKLETLLIANFANLLHNNQQYQDALIYITKAKEVNEKYEQDLINKLKLKEGEHSEYYEYILVTQADILYELGKEEEAEQPLIDILAYKNQPTPDNNYAKALLGTLYAKKGKKELGRKLINEAIKETEFLKVGIDHKVNAYLALAKLELEEDNPTSALKNMDYIFGLHEKADREIEYPELFSTMATALERSGRYKESLINLKQYQALEEKQKQEAAQIKHETFKSQISIIEKKYEINELEIKQKLQESKIYVLVVAFLLSILSVFFIYMMYKKKEDHNNALLLINQEVREANKNVLAAAKAKENFLSTMSHEMCTPMNAVIGITNILLDENPTNKQSEHLKNLKFSGEVLLNIINEVLDFSKISTNKIELIKEPVYLQEFLDRTINSFRQSNSNREIKIYQDQQLYQLEHLVSIDKIRFSQILTNLIGNAIQFTNKGSIVLRSRIQENTPDMVKITFQIEDTGIGIPKEKLESIFESFSQVNNEINRTHEGAGLGLTITKNLIELKGGKLEVTSTEGKGSTFTFTLELGKEEKIEKVEQTKHTSDKIFQSGIEGKKILLVEDNKLNQLVAKKVLKKFKVQVALAENGQEAVDMVQQDSYDLVLMDIHMPIMDGLEATRSIRALEDPIFQQIPIVALSADAYSDKVQATTASGMNDYLAKPFKPEALFQKIRSNIERAANIRGTA